MPRQFEMGWVSSLKRWQKSYKGKLYTVSCRQLGYEGAAASKDGSYQLDNLWWQAKRRELDALARPRNPLAPALEGFDAGHLAEQSERGQAATAVLGAVGGGNPLIADALAIPELRAGVRGLQGGRSLVADPVALPLVAERHTTHPE